VSGKPKLANSLFWPLERRPADGQTLDGKHDLQMNYYYACHWRWRGGVRRARARLTFQDAIIYGRRCLKNGRPFIKPNFAGGSWNNTSISPLTILFGSSQFAKKYSFWKYQLNLL
jgi:hypothetical protein